MALRMKAIHFAQLRRKIPLKFQVFFSSLAKACLKCPGATVLFGKFFSDEFRG
jgi:hypothetical protein